MQVMTKVRAIAAGRYHSLVLKADGSLWTFGSNGSGELGRPLDVDTLATIYGQNPTLTQVMTGVRSIAAGGTHSLALKADGSLWGFGANGSGQLGATADYFAFRTPTQVMTGVGAMAAGALHSLALKADGSLWSSGSTGAASWVRPR